jgi:uncharacterized protein (DUF885 family)
MVGPPAGVRPVAASLARMAEPTSSPIDSLAADYWEAVLEASPSWGHLLGRMEYAGRYEQASREAEDRRLATLRDLLARVEALDEPALDDQQRLTRDFLLSDARRTIALTEARLTEFGVDSVHGRQAMLGVYAGMFGIPDAEVASAMVDKVRGMGSYFAELAERQREGIAAGRVAPAFAVVDTIAQLETLLATPAAENPAIVSLRAPEGIDEASWRADLAQAVTAHLLPGLSTYAQVLREDVLPVARPDDRVGLDTLPGGPEAYQAALHYFTTTDLTAEEIHRLGLDTVAALAEEYRTLGLEVVGSDDLDEIFRLLREDPAFHYADGADLVRDSEEAMARAWAAMPDWFETLPEAPCGVQGVTTGPKAYYFPPAADGSRGGSFFVNISDPASWGTFELESMAFHEGIPGHHLQLTIASELRDVPEVRKHLHPGAYAEGWGLYTERLSDEMGLYSSPLARMGMLSADSMRACRLVVDSGIHAFGWSREQAVRYLLDHSPLTEGVVRPEVDRYILTPGQATCYMVGRVEIQRLRREAEERLEDAFDIKRFHSAVLDQGALPLDVLEREVTAALG